MDLGLKNKVALVAGASKGLGFAVAKALAAEGASVSISSRDGNAIAAAAKRIEQDTGAKVLPMAVDVRDRDAIDRWITGAADAFGGIDALMTNSGGPPAGAAVSFDDEAWQARLIERGVMLRVGIFGLPYGDQGLLISRSLYDAIGGFRALALMEDVDLARRLGLRTLRPLAASALTSADRWRRDGWLRERHGAVHSSRAPSILPPVGFAGRSRKKSATGEWEWEWEWEWPAANR